MYFLFAALFVAMQPLLSSVTVDMGSVVKRKGVFVAGPSFWVHTGSMN